jgi:3D (Asp-Asp-Asp) domain-containing protein
VTTEAVTVYLKSSYKTIAADPRISFGTEVYIDALRNTDNQGLFAVQDRGGEIVGYKIDVYTGIGLGSTSDMSSIDGTFQDIWILSSSPRKPNCGKSPPVSPYRQPCLPDSF